MWRAFPRAFVVGCEENPNDQFVVAGSPEGMCEVTATTRDGDQFNIRAGFVEVSTKMGTKFKVFGGSLEGFRNNDSDRNGGGPGGPPLPPCPPGSGGHGGGGGRGGPVSDGSAAKDAKGRSVTTALSGDPQSPEGEHTAAKAHDPELFGPDDTKDKDLDSLFVVPRSFFHSLKRKRGPIEIEDDSDN